MFDFNIHDVWFRPNEDEQFYKIDVYKNISNNF